MEEKTVIDPGFSGFPAVEATQILGQPGYAGSDVTQQAVVLTCPVCQTGNMAGEMYCQDCGYLLSGGAQAVQPLPDSSTLPRLVDADGAEMLLSEGSNSVGRDAADILLPHPTVSRAHAAVTLQQGRVHVQDSGSTNGTSVSGRRLTAGEAVEAFDGDTMKFGSLTLTLRLPGGAPRQATEAAPAPGPVSISAADRGEPVAYLTMPDGREEPIFQGENSIGRRSTNQISISDAFMSGSHAQLTCSPQGSVILTDLGSTNGSFKDGVRLQPHTPVELIDGEKFTLGKSEVTLRMSGGESELSGESSEAEGDPAPDDAEGDTRPVSVEPPPPAA